MKPLTQNLSTAESLLKLAIDHHRQGHLNRAAALYDQAIAGYPTIPIAHNNLGHIHKANGNLEAALASFQQAVAIDPHLALGHLNLGITYRLLEQFESARTHLEKASGLAPDMPDPWNELALTAKQTGAFDEAIAHCDRAVALAPKSAIPRYNRATLHLLKGDYPQGWSDYEFRFQLPGWQDFYPFRLPGQRWTGRTAPTGTLLVHDEQGLGDTLQFIRYLPLVKACNGRVVLETRRKLLPLLGTAEGADMLIERSRDGKPAANFDHHIPLMSLPGLFGTTPATVPGQIPYLAADSGKLAQWRQRLPKSKPLIGLVWAGRPEHANDRNRSCHLENLLPLLQNTDVQFVSVQVGPSASDPRRLPVDGRLCVLDESLLDFDHTAALLMHLDLLITVDTAMAHLAGALGRPVWVMLPFVPDWRWGLAHDQTPWYPTMRLFRQSRPKAWQPVVAQIAQCLQRLVSQPPDDTMIATKMATNEAAYSPPPAANEQYEAALTHLKADRIAAAADLCRQLVTAHPRWADCWHLRGLVALQTGDHGMARHHITRAISLSPGNSHYHNSLAVTYIEEDDLDEAETLLQRATKLSPPNADLYCNLGRIALLRKDHPSAIASSNRAIAIDPRHATAIANKAVALHACGEFRQALHHYQKALAIEPHHTAWIANQGAALLSAGDYDAAADCFRHVLGRLPNHSTAANGLTEAYLAMKNLPAALEAARKRLSEHPQDSEATAQLAYACQSTADWQTLAPVLRQLERQTLNALKEGRRPVELPFCNIGRTDDRRLNLAVASAWSHSIAERTRRLTPPFKHHRKSESPDGPVTLGYISADFRDHAVAHQIFALFGLHDRRRFRVYGYDIGTGDDTPFQRRIAARFDHYVKLDGLSAHEAARRIHDDRVDILVDLMGHTRQNRLDICALRPAPIQVAYLGYLSTTGADFIDYLIGDAVVTPQEHAKDYSEKLVRLPGCYQIISPVAADARQTNQHPADIPPGAFVFCCFNRVNKITLEVFDCWMRILKAVPHGVLWLAPGNLLAHQNLLQSAARHGINTQRLIFADRVPIEQHIQRLSLADLALDTPLYNGGATTANALYAGVPVITTLGNHFVSRMSASHLYALDLPQLVVSDLDAYAHLAVHLALSPETMQVIKHHLQNQKATGELFDTERYVQKIEKAYHTIWQWHCRGNAPKPFDIGPIEYEPPTNRPLGKRHGLSA